MEKIEAKRRRRKGKAEITVFDRRGNEDEAVGGEGWEKRWKLAEI
jgi:hypothetical protein